MIFGEFQRAERPGFGSRMIELSDSGALTRYLPADTTRHWRDDRATLVQHTVWNTEESKSDHGPIHDSEAQQTICAWARIDNREELAPQLGLNASDARIPDILFIQAAYRKWGEDCVLHLLGDFAFVVWDARRQTLFCARDPMGVRPFYYHLSDDRFLFAGTLKVFVDLEGFPLEPLRKWMAEYMLHLSMSFDGTPYKGLLKLRPGHCLRITREGHALRQYHRLDGEATLRLKRSEDYVAAYREELERAIKRQLRSAYSMGTELSGGIDSSTLTAFAGRFLPNASRNLHAFAFATLEQEREYIDEVSNATPLAETHIFSRYDVSPEERHAHMVRSLNILGYPMEHGNSTAHEPFYRMAEGLGVRTMLSGFGGDEFVTNPGSVALDELWHRKRYIQLYRNMAGNPLMRALRLGKRVMLPRRQKKFNPRFEKSFRQRWPLQPLKSALVESFDLHRRFMEGARFDEGWKSLNEFVLENRWAPFVPTRMENCTLMAASRKIEYRWPLLDVRLVQLFLSIPPEEKYAGGICRLLHKRAIDGIVPHKVAWKAGKSMGDPLKPLEMDARGVVEPESLHPRLAELVNRDKLVAAPRDDKGDGIQGWAQARYWSCISWLDLWLSEVVGSKAESAPGLEDAFPRPGAALVQGP